MLARFGRGSGSSVDLLLGHWVWVVPMLLVVAALSLRQSDFYPPAEDEYYSMFNAGWVLDGPYSPGEIIDSLTRNSPNHTPLYFLLLSLWGQLTTTDILLARILSLLIALMSLSMLYRLSRDLMAPVAGNLAIIIFSSLAFLNYYNAFARMSTLLMLLSAIVLWLYLRITHQLKAVKRSDYLLLGAAVYGLMNTFILAVSFLAMIGIYHLSVAPKNRRWFGTAATVVIALLLFSPWITVIFPGGLERATGYIDWEGLNGIEAIRTWLTMSTNAQAYLLALSVVGIGLGVWRKRTRLKPWMLLFVPFLLTLAVIAQLTVYVSADTMRYHLPGLIPFVLFVVAGIYALYRVRKWLGIAVLLWIVAGLTFQQTARWYAWLGGRAFTYSREPVHVISRLARQEQPPPAILGFDFDDFWLEWPSYTGYSQGEHYFGSHGIELRTPSDLTEFKDYARRFAIVEPWIWVSYRSTKIDDGESAAVMALMQELNYQQCETLEITAQTLIIKYSRSILDCAPPQLLGNYSTDLIDLKFYGAELNRENLAVVFNDSWNSRGEISSKNYGLSYQLINSDYGNVAQVDLPLAHEGELRQFSIDIADTPAGSFQLMAILYDRQTGERFNWSNNMGYVPDMLLLAEIIVHES